MIKVFTDAAVSSGIAVVSALVITDDAFLGFNTKQYYNVATSLIGELYGILDGLRYLTSLNLEDTAILYTDSDSARQMIYAYDKVSNSGEVNALITDIRHILLSSKCTKVEYFEGHQFSHNPNKVVDLTSKTILRGITRKNKAVH